MVGVDEHAYSDYALVWLLNNMVDDGDEVICVRVLESSPRGGEKAYQDDARRLMEAIQAKNEHNRAISIILEYSVGKLHATFQQLVCYVACCPSDLLWLTSVHAWIASHLSTIDACRRDQGPFTRRHPRARQHAQLFFEILSSVQPSSSSRGQA